MNSMKQLLALVLTAALVAATSPLPADALYTPQATAPAPAPAAPPAASGASQDQPANLSAAEIDAIVSPIALYPDQLVAQILGAATYPDQIMAASNWVNANSNLKGDDLLKQVDAQSWDPSVKALTQFPSVLDQLAKNLSWTSALGDVAFNQQADVMASVQRLRKEAQAAGNLKTSPEIKVVQQDPQTIVIQPANPQVVYVPQYNPTVVYGVPYSPPGYSTADLVATSIITFGIGMAIGAAISHNNYYPYPWGWGHGGWGCNWHGGHVMYQNNIYISRSNTFYGNNRNYYRNNGGYNNGNRPGYNSQPRPTPYGNNNRPGNYPNNNRPNPPNNGNRPGGGNNGGRPNTGTPTPRPAPGNNAGQRPTPNPDRGYGQRPDAKPQPAAMGGYNKGGNVGAESNRGRTSFNGGNSSRPAPAQRPGHSAPARRK